MSEDTNENTTLTDAVSPADGRTDLPEGDGAVEQENGSEGHSGSKLHREAAGYRVKLREAEAERDALQVRVNAMLTKEIERLAAEGLSHPADIFTLSGNGPSDYLNEDGDVDPEKVAADVAAILAERPGLGKRVSGYDPTQGYGGRPHVKAQPNWGSLLKN